MSEEINVSTVGPAPSKIVIDAPAAAAAKPDPVDGAGTATKPDAPKPDGEVPAGQDAKDPNLGRAFAALAKKDAALRNREQQVSAEGAQVKAVREAIIHARDKKDPTPLLELAGISPGELTDLLIKLGQEPAEGDRIAALEAKLANDEKAKRDADAKAEEAKLQATVAAYKGRLADVAKAAGDKFEATLAEGDDGIDLAFHVVDEHWKAHGKVLPLEEALALAESHYDAKAKKLLSTKKYGSSSPAASSEGTSARADHAPDTLTNNHVSGAPPSEKRPALTRDQSLAEAARLMESRGWGKR